VQSKLVESWAQMPVQSLGHQGSAASLTQGDDLPGQVVPYYRAFVVLLQRAYKMKLGAVVCKENAIQYVLLAMFSGLIWYDQNFQEKNIHNRRSCIWFTIIYFGFSPMFIAALQFPMDKPLLEKERQSGMYSLSAWFCANTFAILSMYLLWPTLFLAILYWMADLNNSFCSFAGVWMFTLLTCIASFNIGSIFGMWFNDVALALTVMGTYMLTAMLSGGFIVDDIPVFVSWYKYLSFTMYPYQGAMQLEFPDDTLFACGTSSDFNVCKTSAFISGSDIRAAYDVDWAVWSSALVLLAMGIGAGLIAFVGLKKNVRSMRMLQTPSEDLPVEAKTHEKAEA